MINEQNLAVNYAKSGKCLRKLKLSRLSRSKKQLPTNWMVSPLCKSVLLSKDRHCLLAFCLQEQYELKIVYFYAH